MLLAAWTTMGGGIVASSAIITDQLLLLKLVIVLALAFPVAFRMHFSRMPRFYANYLTLLAAVGLGYLEMRANWPPGGIGEEVSGLIVGYRTLVCLFYWIMVFRSFAVRTITDLAQTAIPAASGVLLILIAAPSPAAIGGTVLLLLGTLALLAGEHLRQRLRRIDAVVPHDTVIGGRWRPTLNSWVWLSMAALIAGAAVAMVAGRVQPSNETGRWLRRELAWRLARLMISDRPTITPEGTYRLGGPSPRTRNRVVLTLKGEAALRTRLTAYETYTGRSWVQNRRRFERLGPGTGNWTLPPPERVGLSALATDTEDVQVTAHQSFAAHLPVPWYPREVKMSATSMRVDYAGTLMFGGWLNPGESYTATISYPDTLQQVVEPEALAAVGAEAALQLPESLPARVRELAAQVTADATLPRDHAIAIEHHLRDTYRYDLDAPALPAETDFVDHFLFETKAGYCTHFATAMIVMLRSVGVPARMPIGFTAGEYDEEADLYVVREQDAHAWVEAWLPGTGWVDFDPTPLGDEENESMAGKLRDLPATIAAAINEGLVWVAAHSVRLALAVALATLLIAAGVYLPRWWRRRVRRLPVNANAPERVQHAWQQAVRWLAHQGMPRAASDAPWEFQQHAGERFPAVAQDLAVLTGKYVSARFSAARVEDDDWSQAEAALLNIRDGLFRREH